uniref:CobN/magnesium chelatase domain-containing protein n=1 Tax=Nelumbo nucifera TaxID=4432 RepID=A0A822Y0A4_NELNU|nr:TPA_asm: hypothetical protein HUJ06_027355 [Nelumbo nucifera]
MALEEKWGRSPSNSNFVGKTLWVYGRKYCNLFISVQLPMEYDGDLMRPLLFKSTSTCHGSVAYCSLVAEIFKVDNAFHFGTHDSFNFTPGKQVEVSDICYSGNIFNICYCATNQPTKAMMAKCPGYINIFRYLSPPTVAELWLFDELPTTTLLRRNLVIHGLSVGSDK